LEGEEGKVEEAEEEGKEEGAMNRCWKGDETVVDM
jgi:hypothetical protein